MTKYAKQTVDIKNKNNSTTIIYDLIKPKSKVLDIGCSTGYLGEALIEQKQCQVNGIEIDPGDAKKASEILNDVIVGDVENFDWKSLKGQQFDYIIFADVLEHLKNPGKVLRQIKPFLKTGGKIVASVPNVAHISIRLSLLSGHFDYEKTGIMDNTHLQFFTKKTATELFEKEAFNVEKINYTSYDILDETIGDYNKSFRDYPEIKKLVMDLTEQPEAIAYQYVILAEARKDGNIAVRPTISPQPKPVLYNQKAFDDIRKQVYDWQLSASDWQQIATERLGLLHETEEQLSKQNSAEQEHKTRLEKNNIQLNAIKQSLSWRMTSPIRTILKPFVLGFTMSKYLFKNRQNIYNISSELIKREGLGSFLKIIHQTLRRLSGQDNHSPASGDINHQYQSWLKINQPTKSLLSSQRQKQEKFQYHPIISLLMPTYNTPEKFLRECIESVVDQSYPDWELCIADDCSSIGKVRDIIKEYAEKDSRIKYIFRNKNGHISKASNSALDLATGDFIGFLDHDDVLWPNALYEISRTINENNKVEFIYTDEDKISEDGIEHRDPFFKPDWNPDYLRSINYITHFAVIKKNIIDELKGFREGYEGAQDWDIFLRATDLIVKKIGKQLCLWDAAKRIIHIPTILYSWRISPQSSASQEGATGTKNYAFSIQQKVLEDNLKGLEFKVKVLPTEYACIWRTKYEIEGSPKVSIIVPTKDNYQYISMCIDSVIKSSTYKNYELVIIDTGSKDEKVWSLYEKIKKRHKDTQILKWDKPFNFASVCNFGVKHSNGEYILLLNNDTELVNNDWIESMLEHAQRPEIGAVGAKLIYPENNTIQHAGVILGIGDIKTRGVAGHAFKYFTNAEHGEHFQMMHSVRDYSAVTAACIMIKKSKYLEVNGQDSRFQIAFNDVDFCLKLLKKGYYNLYTPHVILKHYESISVGTLTKGNRDVYQFQKETNYMLNKWGSLLQKDPFYNPNLTHLREDFSIKIN